MEVAIEGLWSMASRNTARSVLVGRIAGSCQYAVVKGKLVLSSTLTRCRQWGEFEFEISNFKTKFGQVPIALGTANTQAQTHKETLNL
jgi:hypothetical protein